MTHDLNILGEGTEAWKAGQPLDANPYTEQQRHADWERGWKAHLTQLEIGPGQTGLDPEVAELVWAMNKLPGIETQGSCSGHGKDPLRIWFDVTDYEARGLLVLSRLLSGNYHGFYENFEVVLSHQDVEPQVCWLLESKFYRDDDTEWLGKLADELAHKINAIVDDTIEHYNILYDRSKP